MSSGSTSYSPAGGIRTSITSSCPTAVARLQRLRPRGSPARPRSNAELRRATDRGVAPASHLSRRSPPLSPQRDRTSARTSRRRHSSNKTSEAALDFRSIEACRPLRSFDRPGVGHSGLSRPSAGLGCAATQYAAAGSPTGSCRPQWTHRRRSRPATGTTGCQPATVKSRKSVTWPSWVSRSTRLPMRAAKHQAEREPHPPVLLGEIARVHHDDDRSTTTATTTKRPACPRSRPNAAPEFW